METINFEPVKGKTLAYQKTLKKYKLISKSVVAELEKEKLKYKNIACGLRKKNVTKTNGTKVVPSS